MIFILLEFHYIFIGDIINHYYINIFQVFKKLAIYKFYKQSVQSSISGILASIKTLVIILTEYFQL